MDEFGIPGSGIYDPTGGFGDMSFRESSAAPSSPSQVPGTSGAPSYTPSPTPRRRCHRQSQSQENACPIVRSSDPWPNHPHNSCQER
jgi:hypothetical protein